MLQRANSPESIVVRSTSDLLYQHFVDPAVPIEDVAGAGMDLLQQGIGFIPFSPPV